MIKESTMKTLNKELLMDIIEYEKVRHEYRKEIIDYKVNRRVALGPNVTMVFELSLIHI